MRNQFGRYRQMYLSLVLFTVLNMAFWAGFFSSRIRHKHITADLNNEQQQQQHEGGSDNNDSERQTETEQHQNGNQVKGREQSRDSKAVRESERGEEQSSNPSKRQKTVKEEEERQKKMEEQENREPTQTLVTNKEQEERQQVKEEQQNRKPTEPKEATEEEEAGQVKDRTQVQEDKQLNNTPRVINTPESAARENTARQFQEQEQSKTRGNSSESLQRQSEEKQKQETGKAVQPIHHNSTMHGAPVKTGVLKQLPIINMDDLEDKKTNVLIVIFVLTSALRYDRRQGIRDTWWTKCKMPQAACIFVTDGYIDETLYDNLLKEKEKYNDMQFLPVDEGLNFGMRLLFVMKWVQTKYKPEFFLRIDDDYFLCIERLLDELPQRPKNNVVWGFWHCDLPTATFMDESFTLLSYDLVETFLSWNNETLLCHPFGDQQLGIWLNYLPNCTGFFDFRLHHHPPASKISTIRNLDNICDTFLGLHGTYPEDMRRFWSRANDGKKALTKWVPVYPKACHYRPNYKWQDMSPEYRYKPELCAKNPRWNKKREMWAGRQ